MQNVIALDAGGATLKASVVPFLRSKTSAPVVAPFVLANQVATLSSSSSSSTASALIGQELLDKERHGNAKLRYVRPVERCVERCSPCTIALYYGLSCVLKCFGCWR